MDWNNSTGEYRIEHWRHFRNTLVTLTETELLSAVARYYASAPFVTRTMDFYDPTSWLTPWEILNYGLYCRSAISLMIYYTLVLAKNTPNISLLLIDDGNEIYLVTLVNNQLVLNYDLGKITHLDMLVGVEIKAEFTTDQLKKIN